MANSDLVEKWTALKVLVESLEIDLHKSAKGNKSASIRLRKGLRIVKRDASDIVKFTLAAEDAEPQP
jgi:hypothetical protein